MLKLQVLVHWIIMSKELCTQCLEAAVHQGKETSFGESFLYQEAERLTDNWSVMWSNEMWIQDVKKNTFLKHASIMMPEKIYTAGVIYIH